MSLPYFTGAKNSFSSFHYLFSSEHFKQIESKKSFELFQTFRNLHHSSEILHKLYLYSYYDVQIIDCNFESFIRCLKNITKILNHLYYSNQQTAIYYSLDSFLKRINHYVFLNENMSLLDSVHIDRICSIPTYCFYRLNKNQTKFVKNRVKRNNQQDSNQTEIIQEWRVYKKIRKDKSKRRNIFYKKRLKHYGNKVFRQYNKLLIMNGQYSKCLNKVREIENVRDYD